MLRYVLTVLFFAFLASVVIMADAGVPNPFTRFAYSVPLGDKAGHFALYGVMAFLLNWAWQGRRFAVAGRWRVLTGSVAVLALSMMEEASQVFFRTRTLDATDAAANAAGILAFSLLFAWHARRQAALQSARH